MPFVCISSFYSGRTYRLEVPASHSPSVAPPNTEQETTRPPGAPSSTTTPTSKTITYNTIVSLIRSLWRVQGQGPPTMDLLLLQTTTAGVGSLDSGPNSRSSSAPLAAAAAAAAAGSNSSGDFSKTRSPKNTSFSSEPGALSSTTTSSSQLVSGSDPVLPSLLHPTEHANLCSGAGAAALLFLMYKPLHRDTVERLLIERTATHPQDLSPLPATQVERGMTALLSVFTALSSKARKEVESLLSRIDAARSKADGYAATLEQDVARASALRDGDVAKEISVSVESLLRLMAEVKTALGKATAVVSSFQPPTAPTAANIAAAGKSAGQDAAGGASSGSSGMGASTSGTGSGGNNNNNTNTLTPEKCYEAASKARQDLNAWAKKLAHANELLRSVHELLFPRFESLRALPAAYPAAEELARRRIVLYQACARVQNQLAAEASAVQEQIAGFVQEYGRKWPQNLLRGLDAPVPMLHVAYEPLLRSGSVPVPSGGGSELLKRLGLLGGAGGKDSSSSPDHSMLMMSNDESNSSNGGIGSGSAGGHEGGASTRLPSANASSPDTPFAPKEDTNAPSSFEEQHQKNNNSALQRQAGSISEELSAAAAADGHEQPSSSPSSELSADEIRAIAMEQAREVLSLFETESEQRRAVENEQSDERLDLMVALSEALESETVTELIKAPAPLPTNDDGDGAAPAAAAAATTTSSAHLTASASTSAKSIVEDNNARNLAAADAGGMLPLNTAQTSPNFLRPDTLHRPTSGATTATPGRAPPPVDNLNFTARYSRALNYNLSDVLTVWAVEEESRETLKIQLCEILSLGVLNFERPTERRSPFASAMGGAMRVMWNGGDAAPPAMSRGTVAGRVVVVNDLVMMDGNSIPLVEVMCEVVRAEA